MSQVDGQVVKCPKCQALLLVRKDQVGRRIRCSKCSLAFEAPNLVAPEKKSDPVALELPTDDRAPSPVKEANEPAIIRPEARTQRAKRIARFERSAITVFQALTQAVRSFNCEVINFDRGKLSLEFSFPVDGKESHHRAFIFEQTSQASEIELVSTAPNQDGIFDPYYDAIQKEVSKYLMFADKPVPARRRRDEENERHKRYEEEEDDDNFDYDDRPRGRPRRRYGRASETDAAAIAGFVCGVVGIVLFCLPVLAIPLGILGIVFGSVSNKSSGRGLATAGIICGIIACILSFIFFLAALATGPR